MFQMMVFVKAIRQNRQGWGKAEVLVRPISEGGARLSGCLDEVVPTDLAAGGIGGRMGSPSCGTLAFVRDLFLTQL